ncbi:MAG TPA: YlxR family protein, partial [bacterium]|nr:YlxR family protein [bacterium]
MNKTKERTCITCGEKAKKESLLRWVNVHGQVAPDWTQKIEGRSVYTHFSVNCIDGLFNFKKLPSKFADKPVNFIVTREKIETFVCEQAERSLSLFLSLSIKSGKLIKGQNLVAESAKKGKKLKYCFCASDLSDKTFSGIVKTLTIPVKKIKMSKS